MTIKLWDWDKGWDCTQVFEVRSFTHTHTRTHTHARMSLVLVFV